MTRDARKENFMLVDMDGYICLFTNARLDRDTIPADLYCYDVRDADCDGTFAEVQRFVMVNHWGTIICKEPIPMNQYHCFWPDRDAFYIPNASLTLDTFHKTPLPELLEPYLSPEGKEAFKHRLPDLISEVKGKPFLERTGLEQEHLLNYWRFHKSELTMPVHTFLGMNQEQYQSWEDGRLLLSDGSYHPMDASSLRLSHDALLIAHQILHAGGIDQNYSAQAIRNTNPTAERSLAPLLSQFMKHLPQDKDCILSSIFDCKEPNLILYGPNDDMIAVITKDEILYKEDFANHMKTVGLKPTAFLWNAVWAQFSADLCAVHTDHVSLADQAQSSIAKVQASLTREHMRHKPGLAGKINSADARTAKSSAQHESKEKDTEPER